MPGPYSPCFDSTTMFSGTIFTRRGEPAEALRLPRSCWAFYERIDGDTPVGEIAGALGCSDAETFAAVRLLQAHDLIREAAVTYADFRAGRDDASAPGATPSTEASSHSGTAAGDGMMPSDPAPTDRDADAGGTETASDAAQDASDGGPGAGDAGYPEPETGSYATGSFDAADAPTQTQDAPVLHLPSLWEWMETLSGNVKHYKNTQAFILMEASGALDDIGVESMDDLEALDVIRDRDVMAALENAVENNLNESIPESCYQ